MYNEKRLTETGAAGLERNLSTDKYMFCDIVPSKGALQPIMTSGTAILRGVPAGILSAAAVSVFDTLISSNSRSISCFVATAGVLAPLGALIGLWVALTAAALSESAFSSIGRHIFWGKDAPHISIRVLLYGTATLFGIKVLYAATLFFATAFHHPGLAAFALLLFLGAVSAFSLLAVPFLARTMAAAVLKFPLSTRILSRPVVSTSFIAGAFFGIVLPPLNIGAQADGPFGFVGLLRLEGGVAALTVITLLLVTAGLTTVAVKRFRLPALPVCVIALVLAGAGPFGAQFTLKQSAEARMSLDSGRGAAAWILRIARRSTETKVSAPPRLPE